VKKKIAFALKVKRINNTNKLWEAIKMASKIKITRKNPSPQSVIIENECGGSSGYCGSNTEKEPKSDLKAHYITNYVKASSGNVPQISTKLKANDIFATLKVRFGIGRMSYLVQPGLYCIGKPDENSPVLVTANYKMSFDSVRKELSGFNVWLLVLDTKGVNVWCAAGKGTFGTSELVHRIEAVKLYDIVRHRIIILPQLGATGVAAHEVHKNSGFNVKYGPVRASDIKAYFKADMQANKSMRKVNFTILDRIVLTPVELVNSIKPLFLLFGIMFFLNAIGLSKFGFTDLYSFIGAIVAGCVLAPVLLPWIPCRAFSLKGAILGLLWAATVIFINGWIPNHVYLKAASYLLLLPTISAYLAMNFTGCSTYTSPTGVNKEMRIAVPIMLVSSVLGIILLVLDLIMKSFL
jgi:hypothetical protein